MTAIGKLHQHLTNVSFILTALMWMEMIQHIAFQERVAKQFQVSAIMPIVMITTLTQLLVALLLQVVVGMMVLPNAKNGNVIILDVLKQQSALTNTYLRIVNSLLSANKVMLPISLVKPSAMRTHTELIVGLLKKHVKFAHQLKHFSIQALMDSLFLKQFIFSPILLFDLISLRKKTKQSILSSFYNFFC